LAFTFRGNSAQLALVPDLYTGRVQAQLDGGAWQDYDLRATDPESDHRVTLADNLLPGEHHLAVRVTQGELLLDGVLVKTSNEWLVNRLGLGILALGVLLGGAWW